MMVMLNEHETDGPIILPYIDTNKINVFWLCVAHDAHFC